MINDDILRAVQDIFRSVFADDSLVIRPETHAGDIDNWDSFNHMTLIVSIEKRFGVKFTMGELQKLRNVGDIVCLVEKKKCDGKSAA